MHAGKKQSRRMRGGMTTGQWGSAVYGASNAQHAVGAGSNVIRMNDPNMPQMKGGEGFIDDITASIGNMMPGSATPAPAPAADEKSEGGILSNLNPFASTEASTEAPAEAPAETPAAAVTGGKGKRKSATKRRKSHKKKGKSSKKRAHKRR